MFRPPHKDIIMIVKCTDLGFGSEAEHVRVELKTAWEPETWERKFTGFVAEGYVKIRKACTYAVRQLLKVCF